MFHAKKTTQFYLRPYFSLTIAASSKSGKTIHATEIVKHFDHVVPGCKIGHLSIIYNNWQQSYDQMIDACAEDTIIETHIGLPNSNDELPSISEVETTTRRGRRFRPLTKLTKNRDIDGEYLLIIDDCIQLQQNNSFAEDLLSIYSHHYKINCILILQQIFVSTPLLKTILRNTEFVTVCASAIANITLQNLQKLFFTGQRQILTKAYRKAFGRNYRFVRKLT